MTNTWDSNKYSFVDIETTGGSSNTHKITEIAIITVDKGVVSEEWSSLINPERSIPWNITQLTGITNEMVEEAPRFFQVAKKIVELTKDRIFVAHNVFFDYRFLQKEFQDLGFTFRRDLLCTVRLSRKAFPGLPSYSLSNLSRHFNLERLAEHRALDDTKACWNVFYRAMEVTGLDSSDNLSPKLPAGVDENLLDNLPAKPGTYSFWSAGGVLLYIGKAKSIRARVTQHFQGSGLKKHELEMKSLISRVEFQEWGSEIAASLMELQMIKTLRPRMNRAGRKTNFRYTLQLRTHEIPGEEVSVAMLKQDGANYGSRASAESARERVWKKAFGLDFNTEIFAQSVLLFKKSLGEEKYFARLQEAINFDQDVLDDGEYEFTGRKRDEKGLLIVKGGALKELCFVDSQGEVELHALDNHPDMRRLLGNFLRKPKEQNC